VRFTQTNVRFTQTGDSMYVTSLKKPVDGKLEVRAPIPILPGDKVSLLGVAGGEDLKWSFDGEVFKVMFGDGVVESENHAWVVKIEYVA
jgi:alpha-L-fucosidase